MLIASRENQYAFVCKRGWLAILHIWLLRTFCLSLYHVLSCRYTGGKSEQIIGRYLKEKSNKVCCDSYRGDLKTGLPTFCAVGGCGH